MNKKFSTLVAGLLLAASFGTVEAQDYTMLTTGQTGSQATTFKKEGAFQLSDGSKVLAMVQENGKYVLKMVDASDANNGVKLAETLWTIRWTTYDDTVKKYYFTFQSAAYNMPLSFSTENAGKDGFTGDINFEFPGKISTWEWQEGIEGDGIKGALPFKYRYDNPDSVMTLAVNNNGYVGAIKYAQSKESSITALNLKPMTLNSVVLTPADLNSKMLTQNVSELLKLTFNADVSKDATNLWTNKYEAIDAIGLNQINIAVKEAMDQALAEANSGKALAKAIRAIKGATYTTAQNELIESLAVIAENPTHESPTAAKTTVETEVAKYTAATEQATKSKAYAELIKAQYAAGESLVEATYTAYTAAVNTGTVQDVKDYFNALVEADGYTLAGAKETVAADSKFANDLAKATADNQAATALAAEIKGIKLADLDDPKTTAAEIEASLKNYLPTLVGGLYTQEMIDLAVAAVNTPGGTDQTALDAVLTAAADNVTTSATTALTTATTNSNDATTIKTAVAALKGLDTNEEYATAVKAITASGDAAGITDANKAAVQNAFIALSTGTDYVKPAQAAIDGVVANFTKAITTATAESAAATAAQTAMNAVAIDKTYVTNAIDLIETELKDVYEVDDVDLLDAHAALNAMKTDANAATGFDNALTAARETATTQKADYPDNYADYVSLYVPKSNNPYKYLRVDTTYLTGNRGSKHLAFATGELNLAKLEEDHGAALSTYVKHDFSGRYNFKFTYFPTEDSLVINTPMPNEEVVSQKGAGFAHPLDGVGYSNMTNKQVNDSWTLHKVKVGTTQNVAENLVKIVVLNDDKNHREVTIGANEWVEATNADPKTTLNTRIGFNVRFTDYVAVPEGVYTIKYVSNDKNKELINGRYFTYNWLYLGKQALASAEDQELNHIPAAQWIVTQAKGENLNSIVNRESAQPLVYTNEFGDVQQQYMFATATKNLYTNLAGDSLLFTAVPEEFTTSKTVGYFIDPEKNEEADDQLRVFSLKYLNNLNDDLFVGYNEADSILNVAKTDAEDKVYFRLIRATDSISYGASAKGIAEQLKHIAYYLQLETPNKNIKDEDKLFITVDKDGKYKLINSTLTNGKVNYNNIDAFFLKEFKEADGHYYALIKEGTYDSESNKWIDNVLGNNKISVKDYPSILVRESLEGENMPLFTYGSYSYSYTDGRTSTFGLVAKDAPKYRRLGVTNAEDGLNNMGTNVAKINITREDNRYLYENTANKVAGYEADPTGINYLGALFDGADKAAMFIDTAYVRNETARPQYLLGLRPNFDPDTTFCPVDHGHPYELVDQVRAYYMVTLADSVAAYAGNKPMMDKFMYENRTYTRLAFVDAVHQGDSLVIMSSKFKGTKNAKNDTIDLSKNAFNNAAVQFRLTKNDDPTAEFYIETQPNEFVRLINGVAVLTNDIADAERFNIAKTDDKPVANEGIATSEVSVIAGNGFVTIKGAAGKNVAISNILGQIIANTVVTSDEATIAAPAGVVVVAVEGEAAVKAIVK